MKKWLLLVLLFLLTPFVIFSQKTSENTVFKAVEAIYNSAISVVSANVSIPSIDLPGVDILEESDDGLNYKISFNRSDLSTYLPALQPTGDTWYFKLLQSAQSLFAPLLSSAVTVLEYADYDKGEVFLDGTIEVEFDTSENNINGFLDLFILRDMSALNFEVEISLIVSGSLIGFTTFTGKLKGKGYKDYIEIKAEEMTCNGMDLSMKPMEIHID